MTNQTHSVDDLLVKVENAQLGVEIPTANIPENIPETQETAPEADLSGDGPADEVASPPSEAESQAPEQEAPPESEAKQEVVAESPIDEYGNPVEKPRMYSEEEVQRMIRDRLSRGRHAEQPTQQQVSQEAKDFKPDPNSEQPWEQQLEEFVERTIEKRDAKAKEAKWKQEERQRQAEFEDKFTKGMSKYQDFEKVVAGKPITNGIMLAARSLENPAAFIYGASKLHPQELERISRISDPYMQATEVGRLHEKMVKARAASSKAGKPLEAPKSDVPSSPVANRPSLDTLIHLHAQQKQKKR